nr:MAG TPA_asm: hypothetical protein [Caudoviricetes sp.]DAO17237.1 MAG TPA: hypothetical protein [Caudoviricetes sp.]DAW80098.1 MAG TPA: hypothetical protein [Caudoviricetes sp.]
MSAARGGHRTVYGLCVHAAGAWSHRNGHRWTPNIMQRISGNS